MSGARPRDNGLWLAPLNAAMWRALVVAIALIFAGCTGFAAQGDTESVTPAPVPTDATQSPPGVTDDGVVPGALAGAHASSLRRTNYTLSTRQQVRAANGSTVRLTTIDRTVGVGGDAYRGQFRQNATEFRADQLTTSVEYWTNGTVVAVRSEGRSGRTEIARWPSEGGGPVADLTERGPLERLLEAVVLTVVDRTATGGVVLAGTTFQEADRLVTPLFVEEPRNVSVRLVVRNDGVVTAQRVAYDATFGSRSVRVVRRTRLTAIGETTVTRPAWIDNATRPRER